MRQQVAIFALGSLVLLFAALVGAKVDDLKFDPLRTQSRNIATLGRDPHNMFVCRYAIALEGVVEGYRDAQIVTERDAIKRSGVRPAAIVTHRAMLKIAMRDKNELVALRNHRCLDITNLSIKFPYAR